MIRFVVFIVAICLWQAPASTVFADEFASETVTQEIHVTMTGDDGDVRITTRIMAPQGPILLPREDWLRVTDMELGGETTPQPDTGEISADRHGGKPVYVTLEGRLPPLERAPRAVAFSPEGSYLIGSDWLPTDERALHVFAITIDTPAAQTAVATGSRIAARTEEGRYRTSFSFEGRASGIGIFTGRYDIHETQSGGRDLRTYFGATDASLSEAYLTASAGYIEQFESRIGPYPYASFSVVSAPIPVGLGFAGLTYVSQSILAHPYMRGRSLAHEVLHSWWGNAVAVDYASGNWAEGLTTFQADHALAEAEGGDAARKMRLDWLRALADLPSDDNRPLTAFRSSSHDGQQAVGYGKAALVFHMLRDEIGAAAFDNAIQGFYAAQMHQVAGWDDLRVAFEEAAGRDLGWFFDQWLTRSGLPEISLSGAAVQDDGTLRLTLEQTAPHYRLRVPVRVDTKTGAQLETVDLRSGSASLDIPLSGEATKVTVDPNFDLARLLLAAETAPILADAMFDPALQRLEMAVAQGFDEPATRLAGRIPGLAKDKAGVAPEDMTSDPVAVIGDTASVAAMRDRLIAAPSPPESRAGTARGWAERTPSGQVFLFISGDSPEDMGANLEKLAFFGQRSFVAFEDGQQVSAGNWPVLNSPMVRDLK
ncbi:aminopeptidase N [Roseovarius litoreus]|uniref:Aminopeptidase N n=2 Tax=Roseovarius litoreus TaxID=1155722 RepID=A0A1M7E634_9RHOB|nr:aminopeptidase N [Roseovarius litoreus]